RAASLLFPRVARSARRIACRSASAAARPAISRREKRSSSRVRSLDLAIARNYPGNSRTITGDGRRSGLPELPRGDAVLLHLEVQRLVVHAEQASRLALVPPRGLQGRADRPSLGVHRSRLGELLERRAGRRWLSRASRRQCGADGEDGEVLRLDHVRREEAGPPNDVAELPHVSRPGVTE